MQLLVTADCVRVVDEQTKVRQVSSPVIGTKFYSKHF